MRIAAAILLAAWVAPRVAVAQTTDAAVDRLADMAVATVGGSVITLSELVAETRLVLLRTRGAELAFSADLNPPLLLAVLTQIVHRELLMREVRRLQLREVAPEEVEAVVEDLRRAFASPAAFDRFLERAGYRDRSDPPQAVPPALAAVLKADLLVERFLEVRVRLNLVVVDDEVRGCFARNQARFEGLPFDQVAPRIRARIREEKSEAALRELLTQLEDRTEVTYVEPFAQAPPPEPDLLELRCGDR